MVMENGISAPEPKDFVLIDEEKYFNDRIHYYRNGKVT